MRWVSWLCTLALLACSHSASLGPRNGGPRSGAPNSAGSADTPAAQSYESTPSPGLMFGDAVDDAIVATLENACADAKLVPDGRLGELARAVVQSTGGEAPSAALVSFHAQRLGLSDPTPQLWLANASSSAAVLASLAAAVNSAVQNESLTHCGGAALRGGHGVLVAVAFSRRLISFATPVPRRVEMGDSLTLSATLAAGYDDASLAITPPHGEVQRIALGRGRTLQKSVRLEQRGDVTLEILASGPEGVTVAALLAIAVGVAPNAAAPVAGKQVIERNPEAVAQALSQLIAKERSQRKLPPLAPHAALRDVAQAHTDDMLAHQFVAHTSKRTGEAQDRVARAGLHSVVLLENIGRGYSAQEIHEGLMESPGHRANILNPDVSVLGVGVGAEAEGERQAFVVTELFARLAQTTQLKTAARDLFAAIEARRKLRKLAKVSFDPALSVAAQVAADGFAANPSASEEQTLARASRGVRALPAGARALSAALIQAEELAQVADSEQLLTPNLLSIGIGVAALPVGHTRQLAVVLLLALKQ